MDMFPNNCNVQEKTGDGVPVGRCWFHLEKGVCPRHGVVKIWDYLEIKQIYGEMTMRKLIILTLILSTLLLTGCLHRTGQKMKQDNSAKIIGIIALIISIIALLNPHIVWEKDYIGGEIKPYRLMEVYTHNHILDTYETFNKNNIISTECYGTNITKIEDNYPSSGVQITFTNTKGLCILHYYKEVWYLRWF